MTPQIPFRSDAHKCRSCFEFNQPEKKKVRLIKKRQNKTNLRPNMQEIKSIELVTKTGFQPHIYMQKLTW